MSTEQSTVTEHDAENNTVIAAADSNNACYRKRWRVDDDMGL